MLKVAEKKTISQAREAEIVEYVTQMTNDLLVWWIDSEEIYLSKENHKSMMYDWIVVKKNHKELRENRKFIVENINEIRIWSRDNILMTNLIKKKKSQQLFITKKWETVDSEYVRIGASRWYDSKIDREVYNFEYIVFKNRHPNSYDWCISYLEPAQR